MPSAGPNDGQRVRLAREPRLDARHEAFVYQREAFLATRDLEYAALFHEQGLGKTKIALDLALYWLETKSVDTVLFVVKRSLVANWLREFQVHTHLKPVRVTQNKRANYYAFNSPCRVMLTHYEAVRAEQRRFALFLKTRNVAVILDESAKIKNPDASLTRVFFKLAKLFRRRVIMTGTPVANRPYDLWAQVWFLDQGRSLGGDFDDFRRTHDLSNELAKSRSAQRDFESRLESVFGRISAFAVRENKQSSAISLPDKITRSVMATWEPIQHELYQEVRDELKAVVVRNGVPTEDKSEALLKRLLRLVQIASHPRLVDEGYVQEPGKWPVLYELLERVMRSGEKCIVWSSFTGCVDWLALRLGHWGARKLHGKLAMERRERSVEMFMSDDRTRILVATPGAAKEGLTLTAANHVVFYDRSFSLDDYLQAQDRVHRISQAKTCYVTSILMEESVDRWVDELLHGKHLAAQLAQGDVSIDYYRSQMSYDFGHIVKEILNIA